MNEAEFFSSMSSRLGRPPLTSPPRRTAVGVPDFWKQPEGNPQDRVKRFTAELENLGGQSESFATAEQLHSRLSELLYDLHPGSVGVWGGGFVASFGLEPILRPYEVVQWGIHGVPEFKRVDVCITGCAFAIADTGTLVMMSDAVRGRSVAVLPSIHIVIVRASQIRLRMGTVLEEIAGQRDALPSSIHFISGPSRSSDIENDQTIGIHGPARVIALILE